MVGLVCMCVYGCKRERRRAGKVREEEFITLGRIDVNQLLKNDMLSFKQKARSEEVMKAHGVL